MNAGEGLNADAGFQHILFLHSLGTESTKSSNNDIIRSNAIKVADKGISCTMMRIAFLHGADFILAALVY